MRVVAAPATLGEAAVVANLMELYLYDFSELGGPPIGDDGRFAYPCLDEYWRTPGRYPFVIRADGALAGFALVAERHLFEPAQRGRELTEFFILRGHRHRGVGRAAARQLFDRFPGQWWVGVRASNLPALTFWRAVVGDYTGDRFGEDVWSSGGQQGVVLTFASPGVS